jgi:hypothetical protein
VHGEPEIGDVGLPEFVDEDVRRLEIAMKDSPLVGMMDRPRDQRQESRDFPEIGREIPFVPDEGVTMDQFHGEVGLALVLAEVMNANDVRVT